MNTQFYHWLGQRLSDYETARVRGLKAYNTRVRRITQERNDGVEPLETRAGLHAPVDGYLWSWSKGDDEFEGMFLAGQFLPMSSEHESYSRGAFTGEIKIEDVPIHRSEAFMDGYNNLPAGQRTLVRIFQGRSWREKYTNKELCHVYISKCPQDLCDAIRDYLMGDLHKLQRLAEQKTKDEKSARDKAHHEGEDVPNGRQVITGVILGMRPQASEYGSVLKMLVQDDRGFRVWGSVPSKLDCNREDHIEFTATVTQSDKDTKFGFFKRPTKSKTL